VQSSAEVGDNLGSTGGVGERTCIPVWARNSTKASEPSRKGGRDEGTLEIRNAKVRGGRSDALG